MLRKTGLMSALALAAATFSAQAEEHYVLLVGEGYFPDYIYPEVGDTIRFINSSSYPMSATASDGSWDSGVLQPNDEYVLPVTDGMKQTFGNSVDNNTDDDGNIIGADAIGVIEYTVPAPDGLASVEDDD